MTSKYPSLGLSLASGSGLLCDEDLCDGFVFIFSLLWQCRLGFCFFFFFLFFFGRGAGLNAGCGNWILI